MGIVVHRAGIGVRAGRVNLDTFRVGEDIVALAQPDRVVDRVAVRVRTTPIQIRRARNSSRAVTRAFVGWGVGRLIRR